MQTFLPYPDFEQTAKCLDYRRLGKQRLEAKQILLVNQAKLIGINVCQHCDRVKLYDGWCWYCNSRGDNFYTPERLVAEGIKIPWANHPAVLMWRGYENALANYGYMICFEWAKRGYKDSLQGWFLHYAQTLERTQDTYLPPWVGNSEFHKSHQSNLVRKFPEHYRPLFPNVPDDLSYFWPTKEGYNV